MEVEMSVYVSQALKTPLLRLDLRPLTPPLDSLSLSHVQPSERASRCAATEDRAPESPRIGMSATQPLPLSLSSLPPSKAHANKALFVHFPVCNAELTTTVEFPSQAKTPLASLR